VVEDERRRGNLAVEEERPVPPLLLRAAWRAARSLLLRALEARKEVSPDLIQPQPSLPMLFNALLIIDSLCASQFFLGFMLC
jgi:hypothetical protein